MRPDQAANELTEVEAVVLLVWVGEASSVEAPEADERGEVCPPCRILG